MHFRILKMIASSDFLTALECTKFIFSRGSAPDPAGGAYSAPQAPYDWLRGPTTKEMGEGERQRKGLRGWEGEERRGKEWEGDGKEREGRKVEAPLKFLGSWVRPCHVGYTKDRHREFSSCE